MPRRTIDILFVCTGNICRSPMAEAVGAAMAARFGKDVAFDSAGIGDWHVGEPADPRAVAAASLRGYEIPTRAARQVENEDFTRFDHLVALDASHKRWLITARDARRLPDTPISLLMDWSVGLAGSDVPDPYYADAVAFDAALDLIEKGVEGLVRRV